MLADATDQQLLKMSQNNANVLVSVAAYYATLKLYPKQAPLAATYVLINSEWVEKGVLQQLEKFLTRQKNEETLFDCLDEVSKNSENCRKINLLITAEVFHKSDALTKWFDKRNIELSPLWLGVVLGQIYPTRGNVSPSKKMQEALQECAKHAGYPRYTYLLLSGVDSIGYLKLMKLALADPEIDDEEIGWLVHTRKDFIKEHIEVVNLDIPKKRKDLVLKSLD